MICEQCRDRVLSLLLELRPVDSDVAKRIIDLVDGPDIEVNDQEAKDKLADECLKAWGLK